MEIPFLDLSRQYALVKQDIQSGWEQVLQQMAFAGGPFVTKFELEFAKYCEAQHCTALNTGTSALHLAMEVLGIGPGDEVILPANTFVATAWGVSYVGATPVFVDCDQYDNIDITEVESKITSRTKAIIGVHLYGQPCNLDALLSIAARHGIYFVEDAAQAAGATYHNKKCGSFGEVSCFSFYPGKNLGAWGEGGGVTTQNATYKTRMDSLRNHGSTVRYYHDEVGYNMRMDGLQAVVLKEKLKHLDGWNTSRRKIAQRYLSEIQNEHVTLPQVLAGTNSCWHLFVVRVDDPVHFMDYLKSKGIQSARHYPVPCHLQKAYAHLGYQKGTFPRSEYLAEHCVSLPMFAELNTIEVDYVIEFVNKYNP